MKNIIKLFIGASLLFGSGCTDEFLENTPQSSLDPSKVDATQLGNLRNSVYAQIMGSEECFFDGYADNCYSRNSWDSHGVLVQTNTVSESENFGYGNWKQYGDQGNSYGSIRVCNLLIDKIEEFTKVDPKIRNLYKSEAQLMRAWHYMKLTLFYGDIAIVKTVVNGFDGGIGREPKAEVRKWILGEFDAAIQGLPASSEVGRLNKFTAYALKARAAYYFGNYAAAEAASKQVIDNGGYQLYTVGELTPAMQKEGEAFAKLVDLDQLGISKDDFIQGIFNYNNQWHADNNSEVILAKEYDATEDFGDFNRITSFLAPNLSPKQAWATLAPLQNLVDDYWMADGKSNPSLASAMDRVDAYKELRAEIQTIQNGPDGDAATLEDNMSFNDAIATIIDDLPNKEYMQQYKNRDSRLYASIVFPFSPVSTYVDGQYFEYRHTIGNFGKTGFVFRKMSGGDNVVSVWGDGYYLSGDDFPIIRLAEMLLIYAEAHTQNTGYDGTVTSALNELRDRCKMAHVPSGLGKEEAVNFIRRERRVELAGEGLRFFDIRLYEDPERNGGIKGDQAASVVMTGQAVDAVGSNSAKLVWAPRLMYLPLPTSSLDNNSALKQNTGY